VNQLAGLSAPPARRPAFSLPRDLVDAFIGTYVDWTEEAGGVRDAYRGWADARAALRPLAFATYRAAVEREEAAACAHQLVVELVARCPRRGDPCAAPAR
jgi:hypothetical protein